MILNALQTNRDHIGVFIYLIPSPTNKNIKKFAKQLELFIEDFSDYEKYLVLKEIISIMKAWDKLKRKVWKKIVIEVVKILPGLNIVLK